MRNRDRNAALLALEQEIERYRPFLDLSPDEALARSETASPAEKQILENLGGKSWGPAQMYFKLSRADLEALRAGQKLRFDSAWDVARSKVQRPHLPGSRPRAARPRLATFTPAHRQEAMSPAGLPFTRMSLKQQQQFLMFSLPGDAEGLQSLDELAGATLRVDYQQPGWYEWRPGSWYRWARPTADGLLPGLLAPARLCHVSSQR